MYTYIPNESKLNSFIPVLVPRVRDVFRRRGAIRSCDTASSIDSRNPIEHFDSENIRMSQYYYEQYRSQVEKASNSPEPRSKDENSPEPRSKDESDDSSDA